MRKLNTTTWSRYGMGVRFNVRQFVSMEEWAQLKKAARIHRITVGSLLQRAVNEGMQISLEQAFHERVN